MSDNSGVEEKDGGFTAWSPEGFQSPSSRSDQRTVKGDRVFLDEPELKGDRWLSAIEEKAREEGYRAGISQGLEEAKRESEPFRDTLLAWSDGLPGALEKNLLDHLDSMVDIVLEAVTKLVGESLSTREGVRSLVQMAIGKRTADLSGVLLVSSEMERTMDRLDPDLKRDLSLRKIEILPDAGLGLLEFSFRTEFHSSSIDPLSGIRELEMMLREGLEK
ncbi:MAG: FliH/SctL family protein [Leptospirillum sp.]